MLFSSNPPTGHHLRLLGQQTPPYRTEPPPHVEPEPSTESDETKGVAHWGGVEGSHWRTKPRLGCVRQGGVEKRA